MTTWWQQFPPALKQLELVEFTLTNKLFVTALAKNCPEGLTGLIIDNCDVSDGCFSDPFKRRCCHDSNPSPFVSTGA